MARRGPVRRVLITGMSGTGKSSVVQALVARGYRALDMDDGWCEPLPDGRQRLRVEALATALDDDPAELLFVAGCEEEQGLLRSRIDRTILLSAPAETLVARIAARTTNPYGKAPDELRRVLDDLAEVEPLLRRVADLEIDATAPLDDVVAAILRLVECGSAAGGRAAAPRVSP